MAEFIGFIIALIITCGIPYYLDKKAEKERIRRLEEEIRKRQDY